MRVQLANPGYKYPLNDKYEKYFIRSGSRWPHCGIKRKGRLPHYLPFPFFLAYTTALLLKEKHNVNVLDAIALDYDDDQFLKESKDVCPEVILFETTTPTIEHDLYIARKLKEVTAAKIVLAGPHAIVYANDLIKNYGFIDYILKNEYEFKFNELVKKINGENSVENIEGIAYKGSNSNILSQKEASLQYSFDILPMPARQPFPSNKINDMSRYWDGFCQFCPAIQVQATRGCPYGCYSCLWNEVLYTSKKYRKFSPQRVVEEMKFVIKEYNAREIYFDDDDFTIDTNYVSEICNLKIKGFQWANNIDQVINDLTCKYYLYSSRFVPADISKLKK